MRDTWRIDPDVTKGTPADNISYYECDVSDWEQVKKAAETVIAEVRAWYHLMAHFLMSSSSGSLPFS